MSERPDIGAIYDRFAPQIYRYVYHRLGQRALAEDMTSEVFLRFLRARTAPDNVSAYLYRTAHNLIVDYLRRNPDYAPLDDDLGTAATDPSRIAEVESERARLRRAILRLSPDQQQVIVLKFLEGLSNAEIGEVIGKPEGAVKSLQHRALANLRGMLGGQPSGTGRFEFARLFE